MPTAYFVKYPRVLADLWRPHLARSEQSYEVVGEVTLAAIDYENFVTDLLADRRFIEDAAPRCAESAPMRCLLVRRHGRHGGVLIVPDRQSRVKWAAYLPEENEAPPA